jgi:enoyl-CoA hydratase/carnithine racemase
MSTLLEQFVITEISAAYWRITFGNPPVNLVNPETILELKHLVELIESQKDLRVVVFDSANSEFYFARYDLSRAAETPVEPGPTGFPAWIDIVLRLAQSPVVSIGSIRGRTRGGGSELALAFDMRFASREKAVFGQPEVAGGVLPGVGANERLPRLMGIICCRFAGDRNSTGTTSKAPSSNSTIMRSTCRRRHRAITAN